jgi:hypothetical protein
MALDFAEQAETRVAASAASLSFDAPYLIEKLLADHVCASEDEAWALFREVKRYLFLNRGPKQDLGDAFLSYRRGLAPVRAIYAALHGVLHSLLRHVSAAQSQQRAGIAEEQ